jgi:hypothetical protein
MIEALAGGHGLDVKIENTQQLAEVGERIFDNAAFFASQRIVSRRLMHSRPRTARRCFTFYHTAAVSRVWVAG